MSREKPQDLKLGTFNEPPAGLPPGRGPEPDPAPGNPPHGDDRPPMTPAPSSSMAHEPAEPVKVDSGALEAKRYRIASHQVGSYRAGETVTREMLIPTAKDATEEQKKAAIREGITRLLDLGAIIPAPDED